MASGVGKEVAPGHYVTTWGTLSHSWFCRDRRGGTIYANGNEPTYYRAWKAAKAHAAAEIEKEKH